MIEIKGFYFLYGGREVLRGVNLRIKKGEVFGFFGLNGVGKSIFILYFNGLLKLKKGEVIINGINLVKKFGKVRKIVGFVF